MPSTAPERTAVAAIPDSGLRIHVMAAVIRGERGIFLARRPEGSHQGGLWEFPGGKLEAGETPREALFRELHEEIGIRAETARPLIRLRHDYPDKSVLLDVWQVERWSGRPHGREGQETAWVREEGLAELDFPAANKPIVGAARLPERYLISPAPGRDESQFLAGLELSLAAGVRLVRLRAPAMSEPAYKLLAGQVRALTRRYDARLILSGEWRDLLALGADGLHLDSRQLLAARRRPVPADIWLGASCHNLSELRQAERIGADFAVLGPVLPTPSHPGAATLGWRGFADMTDMSAIPVYALGGASAAHLDTAWRHGGQGIAGIRGLWQGDQ